MRASAWVISSKPIGMVLQLVRSLVLTRLLFPEAFGLMALVGVIQVGVQMCSDVGIGPNIIQSKRGDDPEFLRTAWTLQVLRGVVLWLICCGLAWPASVFYEEPMILWLMPVTSFCLVIGSFNTTAWATHGRVMHRGRMTIIAYGTSLASMVTIILFAWWLRSVWALVLGGVAGSFYTMAAGHLFLPGIKHRFRWDRAAVRELVGFGKWVFISTLLTFFAMQLDKLLLGKLIPMSLLGVYSIALVLANLPRDLLGGISSAVLFPALAEKFRDNPQQMHDKVNRARGILLRLGLMACVGVTVFAPAFFMLYDPRYAAAGWIAQFLSLSAWVTVLNATTGYALLALGDSKAVAAGNLFNVIITVGGAFGGFYLYGLPGFIVGYAAGTASGQLAQGLWIRRYGIGVLRQDAVFTLVGLASVGLFVGALWALEQLGRTPSNLIQSAIGAVIWLVVALICLPPIKRELAPKLQLPGLRWFGKAQSAQ
jgi:O-antigen/teichoic acid export membrane protein